LDSLTPVAIALGSNVGNRATHLEWAVSRLRDLVFPTGGLLVSSTIETAPEDARSNPPQGDFLNAAVAGHTAMPPRVLLEQLLALEAERGRVRVKPGEPRTLDLDLILYGASVIDEPGLVVPHPRFRTRTFVLQPLAEIVPGWIDPGSGETIGELLRKLTAEPPG
jgi:2-amino-4-hydroxy-6-hydroxymethyldihydropteridine diphosphokinase